MVTAKDVIYLEDSETTINGIRIGVHHGNHSYGGGAFNLSRGEECLQKWELIPEGIDMLFAHRPPTGRSSAEIHARTHTDTPQQR